MDERLGIMAPNSVTPYYLCFIDLSKGPFVVDLPPGVRGGVIDGWQYNLDDTAKSAKYLLIGPGQATPAGIAGGTVFGRLHPFINRVQCLHLLLDLGDLSLR